MKKGNNLGFVGDLFPDFPATAMQPSTQPKSFPQKTEDLLKEIGALKQQIAELKQENQTYKAKAEVFDELISSNSLFPTNIVAKSFGWSAVKLNRYLNQKEVQYRHGKVWVLYQKYAPLGYTKELWYTYAKDAKGRDRTRAHTYWTMKGILFIRELLKADGLITD